MLLDQDTYELLFRSGDIRQIARLCRDLLTAAGLTGPPAGPLTAVLQRVLPGVEVRRMPLRATRGVLIGDADLDEWTIGVSQAEPLWRQKWAMLHEAGHIVIQRGLLLPAMPGRFYEDLCCEQFASAMLLPQVWLSADFDAGLPMRTLCRRYGMPQAVIAKRLRQMFLFRGLKMAQLAELVPEAQSSAVAKDLLAVA